MSKHTPGPWSVMFQNSRAMDSDPNYQWWQVPVQVGAPGGVNGGPGNVIAMVSMGGPGAMISDKEHVEANARLIAAAPDLLAALESLTEHLADMDHMNEDSEGWQDALTAIAKAKEETP